MALICGTGFGMYLLYIWSFRNQLHLSTVYGLWADRILIPFYQHQQGVSYCILYKSKPRQASASHVNIKTGNVKSGMI